MWVSVCVLRAVLLALALSHVCAHIAAFHDYIHAVTIVRFVTSRYCIEISRFGIINDQADWSCHDCSRIFGKCGLKCDR